MRGTLWSTLVGILFCAVVGALAVTVLAADASTPDSLQPIVFNHEYHIKVVEVECLHCHAGLTDTRESRLPTIDTCGQCHEDPPEKPEEISPLGLQELAKLRTYIEKATPLVWIRLFRVPDHVYFSHLRHVEIGKLECSECHADMPARTSPPTTPRTLEMDVCIDCHARHVESASATRATTDCSACHH